MREKKWWLILHWLIISNFVLGIAYGGYMVFGVVGGVGRPAFGEAVGIPFESMVIRRLYAIETWILIIGLALYLGITEILPRKRGGVVAGRPLQ